MPIETRARTSAMEEMNQKMDSRNKEIACQTAVKHLDKIAELLSVSPENTEPLIKVQIQRWVRKLSTSVIGRWPKLP